MRTLTLDIGSSSVKAAFHDGRRFLTRTRVPYQTLFHNNRAELDPQTILHAVITAGKNAKPKNPDAISFCTLSSALAITNQHFHPRTNIITHQDRRSTVEARNLVKKLGHAYLLKHTGNLPYPGGIASSSLAWIAKHHPALLKNARIGQLSSLVGHLLTNQWKIDPSQAVFLGLWDIPTWSWNKRLCKALKISIDALPECHWAEEPLGPLTEQIAREWHIPAGTPVIGGFVDTSAAVLQTPMHPGQLTHNCGSTDVLAMCVKSPQCIDGALTRPIGTRGKNGEAQWLTVLTIAANGSALEWARRELFANMPEPQWIKVVQATCKQASPDTLYDDTIPACAPNFSGFRAAIEQGPGAAFLHLSLATTREQLLTAIIRGLIRQSAFHYKVLSNIHRPVPDVFAIGSLTDLASRMHAAWPRIHHFHHLEGDSMTGLLEIARRALSPI